MLPRLKRATRAALLLLVAATAPTLAQATCKLLGNDPLPGRQPITDQDLTYRKWNDFCLGETRVTWHEWNAQQDWDSGHVHLERRFDYYVPVSPVPHNRKLVIWAHPNGQTEELVGELWQRMAVPLLKAGYAVMSVETRHAADSFVSKTSIATADAYGFSRPPIAGGKLVPHDDIAQAVAWARTKADALGFDAPQVVLVGQSRGSAVLVNGLSLAPEQKVKGVYVYQAQTTFDLAELGPTFIFPDQGQGLFRTWLREDFPPISNGPATSAIALASTADPIPVHMSYDLRTRLNADGSIRLQCYQSKNQNRIYLPDLEDTKQCAELGAGTPFNIHDANYGKAFANAYAGRAPGMFSMCERLGDGNVQAGYADLVTFANAATAPGPYLFEAGCGGVAQP